VTTYFRVFAGALCVLLATTFGATAAPSHGLSTFGDLKYGEGFEHLDYVNPDAPKGGTMALLKTQNKTSFDSLNAFILGGEAPQALDNDEPRSLVYDSLMTRAWDEPDAVYGLVAGSADLADDKVSVVFHLRAEARWHDGTPITADDVAWTFSTLKEKGHPRYAILLRDVIAAEVIDSRTVKFSFNPEGAIRDLPMRVAILPILSKVYYATHEFAKASSEVPLSSGPYKVGKVNMGRNITYDRVADYWAKDLPINKGRFNFDHIRFEYFRERPIALEAFLAGQYDMREEFMSKLWATGYKGPNIDAGLIVREELPDNRPSGAQAFFINQRRPMFSDPLVRQALDLAFDFQWTNHAIFYDAYKRMGSIFENSTMKATGTPEGAELALLVPFRDQLPANVFGPAYVPPVTDGKGNDRVNLRQAAQLLRQAGWRVKDGVLTNAQGIALELEFIDAEASFERIIMPYVANLKRLGINATVRTVDSAQYQRRMKDFDFDVTTSRYVMPLTPGLEQRNIWSSQTAKIDGSLNIAGIQNDVVDALIDKILTATNRDELVAASRALDRVIMHGHYLVPQWYKSKHTLAWWDRFSRPDIKPLYTRGVVDAWWWDAEKSAAIDAVKAAQ
jgi:microcin C transport system substrate-binding protein